MQDYLEQEQELSDLSIDIDQAMGRKPMEDEAHSEEEEDILSEEFDVKSEVTHDSVNIDNAMTEAKTQARPEPVQSKALYTSKESGYVIEARPKRPVSNELSSKMHLLNDVCESIRKAVKAQDKEPVDLVAYYGSEENKLNKAEFKSII